MGSFLSCLSTLGTMSKQSKARVLLDPRFQMVHYLDANGLERTASGLAAHLAPILEIAGYVVKSRSAST